MHCFTDKNKAFCFKLSLKPLALRETKDNDKLVSKVEFENDSHTDFPLKLYGEMTQEQHRITA